jgi:hypothetical protein
MLSEMIALSGKLWKYPFAFSGREAGWIRVTGDRSV